MNQNTKQFSADDNNFKLDDYYGSHMVFQRDQKQPICVNANVKPTNNCSEKCANFGWFYFDILLIVTF